MNNNISETVPIMELKSGYYLTQWYKRNRKKYDFQNDLILAIVLMHQGYKTQCKPWKCFANKARNLNALAR